ncbi:MAG: hypothetical protein WAM04_01305 [Candidatus Sulfotelmatobacter sp.]
MRSADGPPVRPELPWSRAQLTIQGAGFALVFLLLLLLAGRCICALPAFGQDLPSDDRPKIVRGTVVNAVTNQPVGRALVYSTNNRYATMTDGEGQFEFTLPKAEVENAGGSISSGLGQGSSGVGDNLWLMARKPGFLLDEGGPTRASPGAEVTLALMPEGLIKGRITLPAADPVHSIDVQLMSRRIQDGSPHWTMTNAVATNSNGEFRFAELRPGTYKVLTREWMDNDPEATVPGGQLYGYPPVYYASASDFSAASTIQLMAGQTFQADMSLVRQPYYPVKIPVTNADQPGLNITVSPQGQRGPGYSLGYNRGRSTIEGQLPNGKYLVEAETYLPNSETGSVNLLVTGAPAEGPAMVLTRNNSITVNVKEEFSSNDSSPRVSWSDGKRRFSLHGLDLSVKAEAIDDFETQRSAFAQPPMGSNDNSLILGNVVPGRYWLRLTPSRGYVASATMGGADLLREPLVVVPGASASIDITLRDDTAEIEGTLLGIAPTPADPGRWSPQSFIYCIPLPDSSGQFLELSAGADGKFDYRTVAPGVYRVIAFSSQQRDIPYRDAEAMKAYETKGQIVHFAPGQKVTLQLQVISDSEKQ